MHQKLACVLDKAGNYRTYVLVLSDGETDKVQHYTLADDERLAYISAPPGELVKPRWDGNQWVDVATPDEIAQWETEHPAVPAPTPGVPDRLADLEEALAAMMYGGDTI